VNSGAAPTTKLPLSPMQTPVNKREDQPRRLVDAHTKPKPAKKEKSEPACEIQGEKSPIRRVTEDCGRVNFFRAERQATGGILSDSLLRHKFVESGLIGLFSRAHAEADETLAVDSLLLVGDDFLSAAGCRPGEGFPIGDDQWLAVAR
jgi:hypothetical protein